MFVGTNTMNVVVVIPTQSNMANNFPRLFKVPIPPASGCLASSDVSLSRRGSIELPQPLYTLELYNASISSYITFRSINNTGRNHRISIEGSWDR